METDKNSDGVLQIIARAEVKLGREGSFEKAFQRAAELSRSEEGNLGYQLFKVHDQPGHYVVLESWVNEEALHSHMGKEHTKELFESLEEELTHHITEHLLITSEVN